MFYSGNPQLEPGAVVCRVARSFIRFGTFQLPVSRGGDEGAVMVRQLCDYVIKHFYAEECSAAGADSNKYAAFLAAVARRTGFTVSEWQRVGFVHGVLNTDNLSILGDTIGELASLPGGGGGDLVGAAAVALSSSPCASFPVLFYSWVWA